MATPRKRTVAFEHLPAEVMWADDATGSDTNRDFETWWQTAIECDSVRYFPDQTASGTYIDYHLIEPSSLESVKDMYDDGAEVYSVELELNRVES